MTRRLSTLFVLVLATLVLSSGANLMAGGGASMTPQQMEEAGIDNGVAPPSPVQTKAAARVTGKVLLIPDSTADIVAMFSPQDGSYLGDLINGVGLFSTPINAVQGPDGNIYVSDQVKDSVYVYDIAGTLLYTYADGTDGLDNIRGIDWFGGHLFVTSGNDYVAEFSAPHTRLPDFIADGSDPFDIHFLPDGRSLMSDIGGSLTVDGIRLYFAGGAFDKVLFTPQFPEQIADDSLLPGEFLESAFTDKTISDFDIAGTVNQVTPLSTNGRGVYRLGNGNLLQANGAGVQELAPGTGTVITQIKTGSGWRYIEEVMLSAWTDLGNALPGVLGAPVLTGDGALSAGNTVTLTLTNALPNTTAFLVVGAVNLSLPFYGGIIVPYPTLIVGLPTGAAGSITLPALYPAGVPAGIPIYVQYWIVDASGPEGYTASNGITATTE
ncbi:MAG: hypothetical protein HY812_12295 [Planctomycetes bacterium]|nr:hypothetical protein [Planctomycetota bacterium]